MKTLKEFIVKGFVLDDEWLIQGRCFGKDYFDELLERMREICTNEWHESEQGRSPVAVYGKSMSQTKPRSGDPKRCRRYAACAQFDFYKQCRRYAAFYWST